MKKTINFIKSATLAIESISKHKSADKLADFFHKNKIKGHPDQEEECPIATFFKKTVKGSSCEVNEDCITISLRDENSIYFPTSPVMKTFIYRFDIADDEDFTLKSREKYARLRK
jgi:hypothetical protein